MKIIAALAFGSALAAMPALAQDQVQPAAPAEAAPAPAVMVAPPPPAPLRIELPKDSMILLSLEHELHSSRHKQGDVFPVRVSQDVRVGDTVVIPRGTGGVGEITWRTGKGSFGKSAKMEVTLRYIELDGRRLAVDGHHRQVGEGNTAAAVGAIAAAGVIGGLIVTGRSAIIPEGYEFAAQTAEAIPFVVDGAAGARLDPAFTPAAVRSGPLRVNVTETPQESCAEYGRRRAPADFGAARDFEEKCERARRRANRG